MTAQVGSASLPFASPSHARNNLRREMRRARRLVSRAAQRLAARKIAQQLTRAMVLRPGRRVGVYLALAGELNLQPTIRRAWALSCSVFVPHIVNAARSRMAFYAFTPGTRLRVRRWGIPELPSVRGQPPIKTIELDVVLVPTVAFDADGHRLGMGAGFYDRHFARLQRHQAWRRPQLIGVAYSFQQTTALQAQAHDVNLDAVVTEQAFIRFGPRHR